MTKLLTIREEFKRIYASYNTYIRPIIKAIIALISIIIINSNIGQMSLLKNPVVVIILSLVAAFLPNALLVMMLMAVILAHVSAIAIEMAGFLFIVIFVMYLFFFRFTSKDSVILLLVPLLFFLKIPYIVPLMVGLVLTPVSIISVVFGIIIFFFLNYISSNFDAVVTAAASDGLGQMSSMANAVFKSKALYLTLIAFILVICVVYVIKRLSIDYSWIVSVLSGGVLCMIIMLIGNLKFDMNEIVSIVSIFVGGIISIIIVMIGQFFVHSVDYSRTEYTQFEDDEYYYYVKAVPKIKVTTAQVNVKRINARKLKRK